MKKLTPLKAIKEKCKNDCCAGYRKAWRNCNITNCPLWNYRLGTMALPTKD